MYLIRGALRARTVPLCTPVGLGEGVGVAVFEGVRTGHIPYRLERNKLNLACLLDGDHPSILSLMVLIIGKSRGLDWGDEARR